MAEHITIARQELHKVAAEHLREMIASKKLQPGDRVPSEQEMIELFGVGRSTVREAIKLLVAENVVEIHRGKGTFVSTRPGLSADPLGLHFTDQEKLIENLFETRLIIEPQMAWFAAKRATARDIECLGELTDQFDRLSGKDALAFAELDIQFHTQMAFCTHNDVLCRFLPSVCESIYKSLPKTTNSGTGSQLRAKASHQKIFAAIKVQDYELAKEEMRTHIRQTMADANIISMT
ncbi:MAG: FadR family transcriptional regulator [Oscillospiraceae bacterium]|nr:FadR family transcriptional regulator [Oscillospiraceae bacterium]